MKFHPAQGRTSAAFWEKMVLKMVPGTLAASESVEIAGTHDGTCSREAAAQGYIVFTADRFVPGGAYYRPIVLCVCTKSTAC